MNRADRTGAVVRPAARGSVRHLCAQTDAQALGIDVTTNFLGTLDTPTVTALGRNYVLNGASGEALRLEISKGVEFGGWTAKSLDTWCVWVTAPNGDIKD